MKQALTIGAFTVGLLGWLSTAQAELRVHQDRFTLDVQGASLEHVLEDLSRQGSIAITILENGGLDNAIVTKQFANLSIEEGLHRLLLGWNYGLTKDRLAGRVQKVLIVSERTKNLNDPPVTPPAPSPTVAQQQPAPSYEEEPSQEPKDELYRDDTTTDEFPTEDDGEFKQEVTSPNSEELPDDTIPDDLPPDVQEAMLLDLQDITGTR